MLISIFLMQAAATAAPVAKAEPEPVIVQCPTEPAIVPPFGESCAAKQQAVRISNVVLASDAKAPEAPKADYKDAKAKKPAS
jgi:hypothetical protein